MFLSFLLDILILFHCKIAELSRLNMLEEVETAVSAQSAITQEGLVKL